MFVLNGISIIVDKSVLPYIKGSDHDVLEKALSATDTSPFLNDLSDGFKCGLFAICGAGSANLLGFNPKFPKRHLKLNHLERRPIEFYLKDKSQLPGWTKGKLSKSSSGDQIIIERILGPPSLQGDHKAVNPVGALDFVVSSVLRDAVWINESLCLVSQEYTWPKQYLAERCNADVYKQCLASTRLFGWTGEGNHPTYEESGIKYFAFASAPFRAQKEIDDQHRNKNVAIVGPNSTLLRPGMGVVIDPPLLDRAQAANVESIVYGSVTGMESGEITLRLLLDREKLPGYVIGELGPNDLLQTNLILKVPSEWVAGTFRVWPSLLFQAECIPQKNEGGGNTSKFQGRIVVCDAQIKQRGAKATSVGEDEIMATFDIFQKLHGGQVQVILRRMKPFAADAAPGFIHAMNELNGGLHPPAFAYQPHLKDALSTFARKKAEHATSSKDPHTIRLEMPGIALMELVYLTLKSDEFRVYFKNGVMMLEVRNPATLAKVIGFDPFIYDLKKEGYGEVEFKGPFVLKWSLYVSDEPSGPLWGSASISIGSYTEKCRMGTDVIKSSREHPEALRGSGIAVKKARVSKDSSLAGRTKQATKAPAQAQERQRRQEKRMALKSTRKGGALAAAAALTGGGEGAGAAVPLAASAAASSDCPSPSVLSADKPKSGQRPPACIHLRCIV